MARSKTVRPSPPSIADMTDAQRAAVAKAALTAMSTGQSLRAFCIANNLPYSSTWELLNPLDGDNSAYARARVIGTHYLADECQDIADGIIAESQTVLLETLKTATEYAGVDPALLDAMGVRPAEISDMVAVAKVRIDTRMRLIGKWNRDDYGDKRAVEHSGSLSVDKALAALDDEDD